MLERLGRLAPWKQYGLLVLVSLALFLPFLWMMPITEADEAIYAEATREMVTTGNYLMPHFNSAPFYEKPIMTFWLQAASCRVLGISAFAVRLPSALLSLLLVLALFAFLRRWLPARARDDEERCRRSGAAFLGAMALASMPFIAVWAHAATMDIPITFFVSLTVLALISADLEAHTADDPAVGLRRSRRWYLLAGVGAGLAILTKGPIGLALPGLIWLVYHISQRNLLAEARRIPWLLTLLIVASIGVPWYVATYYFDGPGFVQTFIVRENFGRFAGAAREGHGSPIYLRIFYYLPIALLLFFPYSAALVREIITPSATAKALGGDAILQRLRRFAWCWVAADLALFSLSSTQLPSYIQAIATGGAIIFALHMLGRGVANETTPFLKTKPGKRYTWGRWVELSILTLFLIIFTLGPIAVFYILQPKTIDADFGAMLPYNPILAACVTGVVVVSGLVALILYWSNFLRRRDNEASVWATLLWVPLFAGFLITAIAFATAKWVTVQEVGIYLRSIPADYRVVCFYNGHPESLTFNAGRKIEYYRQRVEEETGRNGMPPMDVTWLKPSMSAYGQLDEEMQQVVAKAGYMVIVTDADGVKLLREHHPVTEIKRIGEAIIVVYNSQFVPGTAPVVTP
ncbi:MAG: glycosyltransferase family 39 protein [bacterium]